MRSRPSGTCTGEGRIRVSSSRVYSGCPEGWCSKNAKSIDDSRGTDNDDDAPGPLVGVC